MQGRRHSLAHQKGALVAPIQPMRFVGSLVPPALILNVTRSLPRKMRPQALQRKLARTDRTPKVRFQPTKKFPCRIFQRSPP